MSNRAEAAALRAWQRLDPETHKAVLASHTAPEGWDELVRDEMTRRALPNRSERRKQSRRMTRRVCSSGCVTHEPKTRTA